MKSGIIYPQVISYPMTWIADTQIFPLYFRSINQNADLARGKHLKNLSKFYSRYGPNSSMCQGWLWTSVEWSQLATAGTLGTSWKYSQFHLQDEVRGVHKWRNTFFDQKGNHQFKCWVLLNGCSNYSAGFFWWNTISHFCTTFFCRHRQTGKKLKISNREWLVLCFNKGWHLTTRKTRLV